MRRCHAVAHLKSLRFPHAPIPTKIFLSLIEVTMAIVTFKSNAAGEIYMFRETAEKVFKVIGKPLGIRGVLTPEELPAAIAALKTEIQNAKPSENGKTNSLRKARTWTRKRNLRSSSLCTSLSELTRCWKCLN